MKKTVIENGDKMNIKEYLQENILFLDGGMGTLLQAHGLKAGELPERWNITHPEIITRIHRDYFDAGSNLVNANTFGANTLKFSVDELDNIVSAAIKNARDAAAESSGDQPKWVALDIGPTGKILKPYGDLDFEDAVAAFAETVKLGVRYGADLIFIETMSDSYETKAALLAAKENSDLPVFVSNAYGAGGKIMTGADPAAMVAMLEGMGADAIGVNCSLGPKALVGVVEEYLKYASVPVLLKPNAGLPKTVDGKCVYDVLPGEFAEEVSALVRRGVRLVGGCCGTTPEYISETVRATQGIAPVCAEPKNFVCASSRTHAVIFGSDPVLIGEKINPTLNKRVEEAILDGDMDSLVDEGMEQQDNEAQMLAVNVAVPDVDEVKILTDAVCEIQTMIDLPLRIDTSNAAALESALRRYNGKAMINSVNGEKESMDAVFPLVKKYGGLLVAVTINENGISESAECEFSIAERIVEEAKKYGIDKKNIIFDSTPRAAEMIKSRLGCAIAFGISDALAEVTERDTDEGTFSVRL